MLANALGILSQTLGEIKQLERKSSIAPKGSLGFICVSQINERNKINIGFVELVTNPSGECHWDSFFDTRLSP